MKTPILFRAFEATSRGTKIINFIIVLFMFSATCYSQNQNIEILIFRKTEGFSVKAYLVFDTESREGALIDAGVPLDSINEAVERHNIKLKYVIITHGHPDHIEFLPQIRKEYPIVKVGISKVDYEDMALLFKWREVFSKELVDAWEKDSILVKLMDYDYSQISKPDVFLANDEILWLGKNRIRVVSTPGHTRGSLTFSAGNLIMSGDLIVYHETGFLESKLSSKEEITKSILKLYGMFPDETIIYAGHGKASTIGYEKINNKNVTALEIKW
jgi:hydroxyacylglutathione hydrolase